MARQLRRAALVAALVVALDRATKLWVIEGLGLPERLHVPV
jgi:lipoprotein signal peptidase